MIAQSEVRQRGMQVTKSLTPHVEIILSLRLGHKMIYMDILPLPRIHEEQLSAARVDKVLAHYLIEACLRTVRITGPA